MYENKIIIRSVFKVTACIMEPAINPTTKRYPDSVRKVNSLGDMILSEEDKKSGKYFIAENERIELFDGLELNLDDPHDAAWWEAIRYSKKIAKDRSQKDEAGNYIIDGNQKRYGNAEFFIERPGVETKSRNDYKRVIHEAKSYIYKDSSTNLYNKVRLLNNPMPYAPLSEVEDYLIGWAERKPEKIIELYTGTDTHLRLLLLDAQDKGIITIKDKLYYYGDQIVLGAADSAVIAYFKNPDNKRILDLIKRDLDPDLYPEQIDAYSRETVEEVLKTKKTTKS